MAEEHKRKEERELIKKFEAFLKNRENHFFDEESLIKVIAYYIRHSDLNQALKAANSCFGNISLLHRFDH